VLHSISTLRNMSAAMEQGYTFDELLGLCKGQIIPSVPNLQLFHYIVAYGRYGIQRYVCVCVSDVCVLAEEAQ
jgi:hypothetical protein